MCYRIWALYCPFRKDNVPVMGTFGKLIEPVIVMKMETWTRLCTDFPELGKAQFEVGEKQ